MSLSLYYLDGTWQELDQAATGFCMAKLQVSYSHPAAFSFRLHAPQHTRPIPDRSLVYVYYNDGSTDHLLILGHVWEIKPTDSNVVEYVVYDVTMRARQEITVMSGPHGDADVIPRLVYNAKIDNDDDFTFEYAHDAEIGEIIADILTNAYNELFTNCAAAPLVSPFGDAYVSTDLTPLDFIPQEKMVFESEQLGQALERLIAYYPAYRILFTPDVVGTNNKWRFVNIKTASQVTLTLNDFTPGGKHVMSLQLNRNIDKRFTAVRIMGPQQIVTAIAYVRDNSETTSSTEGPELDELWTSGEAINFSLYGPGGIGTGDAGQKWQIADTDKRKISRIVPGGTTVSDSQYNVNGTSYMERVVTEPTLQVTYDAGTTWWTVTGLKFDPQTGIITTPFALCQYDADAVVNPWTLPDNARLIYAYFADPLEVRKPSSGFEGTAYTVAGMEVEMRLYDEMLSVGYENGTPITTATRTAQYEKLAQQKLDVVKDIIYTGGCTIDGLDMNFLRLQKRINFAGVDGNGSTLTTGWEAIDAILTDVEYDFDGRGLTTLTFSSDKAQYLQQSTDALKQLLKIRALQLIQLMVTEFNATGQNISWETFIRNILIDPTTGAVEGEY